MLKPIELTYVPLLGVRAAEMNALQELPASDKDDLVPLIMLRPWGGSHQFARTLERIEKAIGERGWIADFDHEYIHREMPPNDPAKKRVVFEEIRNLLNPDNDFENWVNFIEETDKAVPTLQIPDDISLLTAGQAVGLVGQGRGLVVRIRQKDFPNVAAIINVVKDVPVEQLLFVVDYEYVGREILTPVAALLSPLEKISMGLPGVSVVTAANSVPLDFSNIDGVGQQDIYERLFFNTIAKTQENIRMIYGDYGSARRVSQKGGPTFIPARIDFPQNDKWIFVRRPADTNYQIVAAQVTKLDEWDDELRLWGIQMIEKTLLGDTDGITSAQRVTGVRINIHLHRQLRYGEGVAALHDTEDDWED